MLPGNISSRFCNRVHWRWEAKIQEYLTSVLARASSSVFNWLLLDRAKFTSTRLNVTEQDLGSVWFLLPCTKCILSSHPHACLSALAGSSFQWYFEVECEEEDVLHTFFYFSQQNNWFYHWVSWSAAEANSTAWISSLIAPAWHPGAFERLFVLLFDRRNLWEGEFFAARGWQGKFSLAAHLNWVCWCLPCTKTSNLIWSAWLHRWFEVGFIQPWELSPPMKGTVCEPSGLWQPGTPNWNGCVGKGWAADPQSS